MDDIAVVGMSCKFPGAENLEEYWNLIINGKDAITKVPTDRWHSKRQQYCDTRAGFLKSGVDGFDSKFFGISPREAQFIDPQQRMLLEMSWRALEDAGINPQELKGSKTGVFMGIWKNDYEKLYRGLAGENDMRDYMGNSFAASSARISYFLGLTGSNIATDSGCSSSMVSVHLACQSLRLGESSLAIVGGINLLTSPFNKMTMEHVLAADGRCKTFDEKADGFGRAEGCGILILKKHSHAITDGNKILALIKGSGLSQEGTTSSFGTPSKESQVLAIVRSFESCHLDPLQVDYVEAHGTGTPKGDPIEISAIAETYGKGRKIPLIIGSVKTNIGHTESAAGMAGIIKVILSMNKGIIPPHINLDKLNPSIDWDSIPCVIPKSPIIWKTINGKPRIAGVSSFGISGTNVHVLVEENNQVPNHKENLGLVRPSHILTLSAKSKDALDHIVNDYSNFLSENSGLNLGDVCFSANSGRAHFGHKIAIHDSGTEGIRNKLKQGNYLQSNDEKKTKIAFLFTGQSSQYEQMGKGLYETQPVFRDSLNFICGLFENSISQSLLPMILSGPENPLLHESLYGPLSIFSIQYSLLQLWKSFGITPDLVIGHSFGEFAAACAAGFLSIEEVTKLVYERTRLISELPNGGGMIAVNCSLQKFKIFLKDFLENPENGWVDVACINSPDQVVLSAKRDTIENLKIACGNCGIKSVILASTHAHHSRDMDKMLSDYKAVAKTLNYQAMKCQYISGMSGLLVQPSDINSQYWLDHCRNSVNYEKAIQTAVNENCKMFIEIGPQPILIGLGMQCVFDDKIQWLSSLKKNENNWTTILDSLSKLYVAGHDIDWKGYDSPYQREIISLPKYPFQRRKHWFDFKQKMNSFINGGPLLHPLVGRKVQISIAENIFQNVISLINLPYLADHCVAHKTILPTSAMLEMMLVAGQLTLKNGNNHLNTSMFLEINDLRITNAFEIESDVECLSELVVTPISSKSIEGFHVTLKKGVIGDDEIINWKQCAVGRFLPVNKSAIQTRLNLEDIKNSCTSKNAEDMYTNLWNIGLTFGNAFRSVKTIWHNSGEVLAQLEIQGNLDLDYLGHPVFIDGMIQLMVSGFKCDMKDLHLPVGVQKYKCIARNMSKTTYVYSKFEEDGKIRNIFLYGENGQLLAMMEGISFTKTTEKLFLKSLHSKGVQLPKLCEEIWQKKSGVYSDRLNFPLLLNTDYYKDDMSILMKSINKITEDDVPLHQSLSKLAYLNIVKAFAQLGWKPKIGQIVDHAQLADSLGIKSCHKGLVFRFLEILSEEKLLVLKSAKNIKSPSKWKILKPIPLLSDINVGIEIEMKAISGSHDFGEGGLDLLSTCGEKLAGTMKGTENPLEFLFHADNNKSRAEYFYEYEAKYANLIVVKFIECFVKWMKNNNSHSKLPVLKFLEIGAGTGCTASSVLPFLQSAGINYSYVYTDISSVLLTHATEKFEKFSPNIEYKILNIENDPMLQGFVPEQFDIIIASNVFHATRNLKETVMNCKRILAAGGSLIVHETLIPDRVIDIICGVLIGYNRFSDFNLRPYHTLIDGRKWCNLLQDCGFGETNEYTCAEGRGVIIGHANSSFYSFPVECDSPNQRVWIIISDGNELAKALELYLRQLRRNAYVMTTDNLTNKFAILCEDLKKRQQVIENIIYLRNECVDKGQLIDGIGEILKFTQFFLKQNFALITKLVLITQGSVPVGDQPPVLPTDGLYLGFFKVLKSENPDVMLVCIDLDAYEKDVNILSKQITQELFCNDGMLEIQVAIRNNNRLVVRLHELEDRLPELALPRSPRFSTPLPETRSYVDLKYSEAHEIVLEANDVEIAIRATGLNFKDIMIILKPNDLFSNTNINAIGSEFSGIVSNVGSAVTTFKIGEPVYGLTISNTCGLASHIVVKEDLITQKPDIITHFEAAAIPIVFCTSMYCLETVAKLTRYDTVLIHAATGGVGLSAIQICKIIGAKIVATAGNRKKRDYLRSLGIEHVFDSRNTSYGQKIKEAVQGVDVVLNSLTGPMFKETTLSVCNKNARFIEIGKVNIWRHEDVVSLRPDVSYSIVDLSEASYGLLNKLLSKITQNLITGIYKPLPVTQFDGKLCVDALKYFQEAQHIGKIVISTPVAIDSYNNITHKSVLFSQNATYLITGGLGGIGMEVTKFLAEFGAKYIVLVNRNPPNESAQKTILSLKERAVNVFTFQYDVGSFSDCQNLLETLNDPDLGLPPLKGIFHAATSYEAGIISNHTVDMIRTIYHAKVNGAWNLHILTRNYNLELFLLFSSYASILSPKGLPGYCSANAYLDSLAQYRDSLGLPATSINWGPWSDVGFVVDRGLQKDQLFGMAPFSSTQGILVLKHVLQRKLLRVAVGDFDETETLLDAIPHLKHYLENISVYDGHDKAKSKIELSRLGTENFYRQIKELGPDTDKIYDFVKRQISDIVKYILKLSSAETLDENQSFIEIGMDSLMTIEMKNKLKTILGENISLGTENDDEFLTIKSSTQYIVSKISTLQ